MSTYTYDIPHTGNVYRPPWEPSLESAAHLVGYNTVGAAPQWGDGSDATYSDLIHKIVQTSPNTTQGAKIHPTVNFAAHPEVDVVNTVTLRVQQLTFGPSGYYADIGVRAYDLRTNTLVWASTARKMTAGVVEVAWAASGSLLALLRGGHLAISAQIRASEYVTVRAYEMRVSIGSETPPPVAATRYTRRCRRFPRGD